MPTTVTSPDPSTVLPPDAYQTQGSNNPTTNTVGGSATPLPGQNSQTPPLANNQIGNSSGLTPPSGFTIDTSKISSSDLAGDATPSSVSTYRNQLQSQYDQNNPFQQNYNAYIQAALPNQQALASYTAFSPEELQARERVLTLNQGVRSATNNILGRTEPIEFQQGQQAALQRDYGLQLSGANDTLSNLEAIRQNNISVASALLAQQQSNYTNQSGAIQNAQNYGIQKGQLAATQQQVSQGRYDYQQITDPQTGFPIIAVIDKTTGQQVTKIDPNSPSGQAITATGLVTNPIAPVPDQTGATTGQNVPQANNNPGNLKDPTTGQFRVFPSPQEGFQALVQDIQAKQTGATSTPLKPTSSLLDFATVYAFPGGKPAADGSTPQSYAQGLAQQLGVPVNTPISQVPTEKLAQAVAVNEGFYAKQAPTPETQTKYANVIAAAPPLIANAIKTLPDGTAYIDAGSLADGKYNVMATQFANKNGIKVLSTDDAKTAATLIQASNNLQTFGDTFANLAPGGVISQKYANLSDPISQLFDTDFGSQLKAFQQNREGLFQQIRALAGSSPRLNEQELITAANSMPTLSEFNKDTIKDGVNKLVKTQSYLDNAIRALVPSYPGTPVAVNGTFAVLGTNGKTYQFPTKDAASQFLKLDRTNQSK